MPDINHFRKNYQKMYFKKLFVFFSRFVLLILFLTIICCIIISHTIVRRQDEQYRSSIEISTETLQSNLTMLQNMSYLMVNSINYENRVLLYKTDASGVINRYDFASIRNNLSALKNIHPAIQRIALYAPSPRLIITDSGLYREAEYYRLFPQYRESDLLMRQLQTGLDYFAAAPGNSLTLSVSCLDFHGINANLLFSLDNDYLSRILPVEQTDSDLIFVTNAAGLPLFCDKPENASALNLSGKQAISDEKELNGISVKIDGQTMRVYERTLNYYNWKVYKLVPSFEFFKPVFRFVALFLLCDMALLGICFWFALYCSNILYEPISHMVELVDDNSSEDSYEEFNLITRRVSALKEERSELKNQVMDLSGSAQNNILRRLLLYGKNFFSEEDICTMLKEANISMPHPYYFAVILNFYYKPAFFSSFSPDEQQMLFKKLPSLISQGIENQFPDCWMFDFEQFKYSIIINCDNTRKREKIREILLNFNRLLKEDTSYMDFSFGLSEGTGTFQAMIAEFQSLYHQSSYYCFNSGSPQICAETCNYQKKCVIPENLEKNIRSSLIGGNHALLSQLIDSVFTENLTKNVTPYRIAKINNTFFELYENLLGITQAQDNSFRNSLYLHLYDTQTNSLFIQKIFASLFNNEIIKQDANRNELLQYIDKNYNDPNLDLQQMAEHFHFNVNYLSRLFKKQTGINFSEYLTDIRIKNAIKIIENSDLLIDDVALEVGIINRRSFNRIFKKETGFSPAMYRLLHKSE